MRYDRIEPAVFIGRPNRFLARIRRSTIGEGEENAQEETVCHVKNTGRCRELLVPGARVYIQKAVNPERKTAYDLIAVEKGDRIVNMDSQIPNAAAEEWIRSGGLFDGPVNVQREVRYGNSRFDLYVEAGERRAFVEVKGVTLEEDGIARFPDAPTMRGVKHIEELMKCMDEGYEAYLLFVIQMDGILRFEPNNRTHPEFGQALLRARKRGVGILARMCDVTPDTIRIAGKVPVVLEAAEEKYGYR